MNHLFFKIFPIFLLLATTACFNYETQFEGPYEETENPIEAIELAKELVYVAGGKVYLADKYGRDSLILDNSGSVEIASINNNHTKVLFKRANKNIQIYDIEMAKITAEVPDTEDAYWFDFHANNETIYFLANSLLDTYGPEVLARRPINLRSHSSRFGHAWGVAVLENGNFIFSIFSMGTFNTRLIFLSDGTDILKEKEIGAAAQYIRLNKTEDKVWTGDEFDDRLHLYQLPDLTKIADDSDYFSGVPSTNFDGYKITRNQLEIYIPDYKKIPSPGGKITAIDY